MCGSYAFYTAPALLMRPLPDPKSQRPGLSVKAFYKVNPDNQKKAAPMEIRVEN